MRLEEEKLLELLSRTYNCIDVDFLSSIYGMFPDTQREIARQLPDELLLQLWTCFWPDIAAEEIVRRNVPELQRKFLEELLPLWEEVKLELDRWDGREHFDDYPFEVFCAVKALTASSDLLVAEKAKRALGERLRE